MPVSTDTPSSDGPVNCLKRIPSDSNSSPQIGITQHILKFNEVFTAVLPKIQVVWDVTLCHWGILGLLYTEDGDTVILVNIRDCLSSDMPLPPRRF